MDEYLRVVISFERLLKSSLSERKIHLETEFCGLFTAAFKLLQTFAATPPPEVSAGSVKISSEYISNSFKISENLLG